MAKKNRQSDVRYLKRHGKKGSEITDYLDNRGNHYQYKWVARLASFLNFLAGGFKSGFPITATWMRYHAWAMYPFFFINPDEARGNAVDVLNHERIHIHQQREILLASLPLIIILMIFSTWVWVVILPFMHTLAYWINISYISLTTKKGLTYSEVRRRTCFEIEAERFASDWDYLLHRKPFHNFRFIKYNKFIHD